MDSYEKSCTRYGDLIRASSAPSRTEVSLKASEPYIHAHSWPQKGNKEQDHQQEAQKASVYSGAQPGGEQIAEGGYQQPQRNDRERRGSQIAPIERQARHSRGQRRGGQGQDAYDDRHGGERAKARKQDGQAPLWRCQHQLLAAVLF